MAKLWKIPREHETRIAFEVTAARRREDNGECSGSFDNPDSRRSAWRGQDGIPRADSTLEKLAAAPRI